MASTETSRSALYETILSQPDVVRAVLDSAGADADRAAGILAGARRVFLAGTGTSSHAAVVGEHLLRAVGADAYATTNFDLAIYPRPLGADDALVAISHRGGKRYGTLAIERARAAGARVVGLTGQNSPMQGPEVVIATAPQERSATHTASYTANLAALALIAVRLGEQTGADVSELRTAVEHLPESIRGMFAVEGQVQPLAEALAGRGRLVLAGAGPNAVTAREGALKVKESSYLTAEGFELETLLHGGLQAVEAGDVAVLIAAQGPALERTAEAARALDALGARLLLIADERAAGALSGVANATIVTFPAAPEPLSPILAVLPLQFLASLTSGLRGTNPDSFRADDPVYKKANASYAL